MNRLVGSTLIIFLLCLATQFATAQAPKISNDLEHDRIYKEALKLISPNIKLQERDGTLSTQSKRDLENGISLLRAVNNYQPKNWGAFWFSGKASQALGDPASAHASFAKAYDIEEKNPDVSREYALACIELGLGKNAVQATKRAILLAPRDAGLYSNLALAHLISAENKDALNAVEKALEMNPRDPISLSVREYVLDVSSGIQ